MDEKIRAKKEELRDSQWSRKGEITCTPVGQIRYMGFGWFMAIHIATKDHRCSYCERRIWAGEWYVRLSSPRKGPEYGVDRRCYKCANEGCMPDNKPIEWVTYREF